MRRDGTRAVWLPAVMPEAWGDAAAAKADSTGASPGAASGGSGAETMGADDAGSAKKKRRSKPRGGRGSGGRGAKQKESIPPTGPAPRSPGQAGRRLGPGPATTLFSTSTMKKHVDSDVCLCLHRHSPGPCAEHAADDRTRPPETPCPEGRRVQADTPWGCGRQGSSQASDGDGAEGRRLQPVCPQNPVEHAECAHSCDSAYPQHGRLRARLAGDAHAQCPNA